MVKETEELDKAKERIKTLEMELVAAKTPKQEDKADDRLEKALVRLEALEAKYNKPPEDKKEDEEEEEDGDQCPVCGTVLTGVDDDTYFCPGCREYFESED